MSRAQRRGALLWPAVDVGGTSTRVLLVRDPGDEAPVPAIRLSVATPRGLQALIETLRHAIADAARQARVNGFEMAPALAMGTPGRLETGPGNRPVIGHRSATNLESFPGELDGVDLAGEVAAALALPRSRVFWDNDAVVQGRYLIGELLRDTQTAHRLAGHTVVCINPGTGLGGCVAQVDRDHRIEVFTDSHISELLLHPLELVRDIGPAELTARSTADGSTIHIDARRGENVHGVAVASPASKQAEDFISGGGLTLIASGLDRCCSRFAPSAPCFGTHAESIDGAVLSELLVEDIDSTAVGLSRFVADLGGRALARLLSVLHDGEARKPPPFPGWSTADTERLRGVSRFVLGGGMTGTPLGRRLVAEARRVSCDWPDLRILEMDHVADDAGALGAFSLIPEDIRHIIEGDSRSTAWPPPGPTAGDSTP